MTQYVKLPYYEIMSRGKILNDVYAVFIPINSLLKYISDSDTTDSEYIMFSLDFLKYNKDVELDGYHPTNVLKVSGRNSFHSDDVSITFELNSKREKYYITDLYYNFFNYDSSLNPFVYVTCDKSGKIIRVFDEGVVEEGYSISKLYISDVKYLRDMYHFYGNEMDELRYKRFRLYVDLGLLETR